MKIEPNEGYILVSYYEIETKKIGSLIVPNEKKYRIFMKIESDGDSYRKDQIIIMHTYKEKTQVEDNLFLIKEEDIIACVDMGENE